MLKIFEIPQPAANAIGNELTPRELPLSIEARELWIAFHDEIERDMGKGGRFAEMQDVGSKSAEQAARIAGVLAIVDDPFASRHRRRRHGARLQAHALVSRRGGEVGGCLPHSAGSRRRSDGPRLDARALPSASRRRNNSEKRAGPGAPQGSI